MEFDVVTVGNATVDAFLTFQDKNSHVRLNEETQELCVKYGEKTQVDTSEFKLGGNASNVAVGLSRLGLKVGLCAEIGDDELSEKILKSLYEEKVNFRLVKRTQNTKTSFAVAINFRQERTLFVQHVKRSHDFNLSDVFPKWIYLTSLGHEWKKPYAHVLEFVQKTGTKLAFNPGTLQIEEYGDLIKNVLKKTDILFVNKEEAEKITKKKEDLLKALKELGPRVAVITDGKNGSEAIDENNKIYSHGIVKASVIEKTGAGDSYAAGFLAAIAMGKNIEAAMQWGALNSAAVIEKVGAQTGLLTLAELEDKLN